MISAVEVIIDVDFPVAANVISSAVEVMQLADAERRNALYQTAEEFLQRRGLGIEIYEYEALPSFHPDRNQTILSPIKVLHSIELRHAFERSVQTIFPTMVRTLQHRRLTARLRDDGRSVVTAHVVEGAQLAVAAAHDDDRFAGKAGRNEFSWLL